MKKILLVLVVVMGISLVGCNSLSEEDKLLNQIEEKETVENEDTEKEVIEEEANQEEKTEEVKEDSAEDNSEEVGEAEKEPIKAVDFELQDLDGNTVKLSDQEGKVVFINFWATWCGYCVEEMPDMQKMYEEYELTRDDFIILAVNVAEDKGTVESFIEENDFGFTVLYDTDGKVAQQYYATGLPTTWMIDREGNVIGYQPGMLREEDMRAIIETTLGL
ncbi:TlpA family protein disulfide reductase [Vallitalea okinawensis]|uniref:TlpA family protein disulfide reductase n=1 Tax=Vallitalea okinawensis TaxID=2078660 RepID=UPI000CFD0711|nr:TlpA disulfide reductase family protein [Vallitalea okinawensis]